MKNNIKVSSMRKGTISIRISHKLREELQKRADNEGRRITNMAILLICDGLKLDYRNYI